MQPGVYEVQGHGGGDATVTFSMIEPSNERRLRSMNIKERILNKERSWTDILPLVFIQAILWMEAGGFLSVEVFKAGRMGYLFTDNAAVAEDIGSYMSSVGSCVAIVLALLIFKKNRSLLKPLGKSVVTGSAIGLASGFALNAAIAAGAAATGCLTLTMNSIQVLPIIGYLIAILFQSAGEELICRLFIMGKLRRRYKSTAAAIIGNSLFFTVFHLGNPGITVVSIVNLIAVSVFFSLIVYCTENLWIAIGLHTAWNFTQTILFGLPNSGMTSPYSIFKAVNTADGFCYNTGFGVEGSWAAFVVIALAASAVILLSRKRKFSVR